MLTLNLNDKNQAILPNDEMRHPQGTTEYVPLKGWMIEYTALLDNVRYSVPLYEYEIFEDCYEWMLHSGFYNEYALMERLLNVLDKYEYFINVWVGRANAGLNEEEYERFDFDLVDNRYPVYIYNETERYEVVFK